MIQEEKDFIEMEVKVNLVPEIKAMIPTLIGWILRAIFPKIEQRIITFITNIVEFILQNRVIKNERD